MQLHNLKPKHKNKRKKRKGRGGKRGTYCGRGVKGQKARAGSRKQPIIRELIKRYPKLRGYKQRTRPRYRAIVNIVQLQNKFQSGEVVSPRTLIEKKIIDKIKGRVPEVKILGKGKLDKALTVKNCETSEAAKRKIEKVSGKVNAKSK